MKIAVLINHNTAAKFYCDALIKLGHYVYIPLYCSIENNTLQYEQVKKYRNINEGEFINILDNFDFYDQNNSNIDNIINIFNKHFDIIITLHCINYYLNYELSKSEKVIYYVLWGDFDRQNPYINFHNNIISYKNKYYLFCHEFLLNNYEIKYNLDKNKIKYIRLGLINFTKYENTYTGKKENTLLIIISRLHLFDDKINLIKNIANKIKEINIHIIGKNNNINFDNKNIIKHNTFEKEEDLYEFIKDFKINLNINHHIDILQYSSIELACINIPTIYSKNSSISKIINNNNIFEYSDINDLCDKIYFFINNKNLQLYENIYKQNNKILYEKYRFENVIYDYNNL